MHSIFTTATSLPRRRFLLLSAILLTGLGATADGLPTFTLASETNCYAANFNITLTVAGSSTGSNFNCEWFTDKGSVSPASPAITWPATTLSATVTSTAANATAPEVYTVNCYVFSAGSTDTVAHIVKTFAIYPASKAYWTGAVNADWCNNANWACGNVPTANTDAIIPASAAIMPVIGCAAYVKDIDVQGTATLTLAANESLNVFGSFVNTNPAAYSLNGTVNFSGGNQGVPAFTYKNLTLSGPGNIEKTLGGPVTVTGTLLLINGIIKTTGTNMLTIDTAGFVSAGSSSCFVSGPMIRKTSKALDYEFPIGNGSLRPVIITPETAEPGAYLVHYNPNAPSVSNVIGNLGGMLVNEYWDINRSYGPNAIVSMYYVKPAGAASWVNSKEPCDVCVVAVAQTVELESNTVWNLTGAGLPGFEPGEVASWKTNARISSKLVSDFRQFTFGFPYTPESTLPLKLEKFNATVAGTGAVLNWKFSGTKDLAETMVQHSTDGSHFVNLTTIGAVTGRNEYRYTDANMAATATYYRLAVKDKNGKIILSNTVLLVSDKNKTIITGIRPTIVTGPAMLDIYAARAQNCSMLVVDMSGRQLINQQIKLLQGSNISRFDASSLAKGFYSMLVKTADGTMATLRFVKE